MKKLRIAGVVLAGALGSMRKLPNSDSAPIEQRPHGC